MSASILSTVVDYVGHSDVGVKRPSWGLLNSGAPTPNSSRRSTGIEPGAVPQEDEINREDAQVTPVDDPEFRLPNWRSLCIMIGTNALLQVCPVIFVQKHTY